MRHSLLTALLALFYAVTFAEPNLKFIYHTVEKGETLYSISHQYGLKPAEVAQYNDAIGDKLTIHIGQKLKIPSIDAATEAPAAAEASAAEAPKPLLSASIHIVKKGETVFGISKMYSVSKDDLLSWNKIKDNSISIGQKLIIKGETQATAAATSTQTPRKEKMLSDFIAAQPTEKAVNKADIQKAMKKDGYTWTMPKDGDNASKTNVSTASGDITASTSAGGMADNKVIKSWKEESASDLRDYYKSKANTYDAATDYESLYYQNIYSGMNKKSETGVAKLIIDNNTTNTAYYNKAPIGTILKLTNTGNGKSTYAIVIGKIPQAEENSYLMKLSGKVGRNLGAKDYSSIEVVCFTEN
jgi:LysM repeat protein